MPGMVDQLEQDVRYAVESFVADLERAAQREVIRILRSIFDSIPSDGAGNTGDHPRPSHRPPRRRTLTAEEWTAMRSQLITSIRDQPGQSTVELARAVGIPSGRLRPQLRQLANAGAIRIEKRLLGGLWRYSYYAAKPVDGPRVDESIAAAGTAGPMA